jgi:hypothetical protein
MPGAQLRVNAPHVVHETIDGETILIHLGTGAYYSLDGVGAHVWELVVAGADEHEVLLGVRTDYDADPELVAETIGPLLRELLDEGLLASVDAPADGTRVGPATASSAAEASARSDTVASSTPAPFVAPVLSKYTDMQEFMLIDPIHDVEEEAGWPHVKAG